MSQQFKADMETLKRASVFFGHQSVGENIITGLEELARQSQQDLPILDLESYLAERQSGCLVHTPIGQNQKPLTKCEDFERIIDQELSNKIDYALLKFCYIDINRESDVSELFSAYKNTMDGLIQRHPEITFIHTTTPLRHSPGGLGVWIREMLGRANNSKLDNRKRNQFNRLLLDNYSDTHVVDIARSQSTYANGRRESFSMDGEEYYALIGSYTSDGGHLNELGRSQVAQAFAHDLARIIRATQK
ncbi:MAG: hypothetical protein ABW105_06210 [Candidatus Thiodiazotropha sp. 6PLUC1]